MQQIVRFRNLYTTTQWVGNKYALDDGILLAISKLLGVRYSKSRVLYREQAKKTHTACFAGFIRYFNGRDTEGIAKDAVNANLLDLVKNNPTSTRQQNQRIHAIKFYYEKVLGQTKAYYDMERPRREKLLPVVLRKEEIGKILSNCNNIKHQCILALIYSAGLRRSELINLKTTD
ncbi:MAG: site-specific integrase, partial [Bacteroidales bacterium]|nr:site-specific integrase [Bacteroidales bacterium]